MFLRHKSLIPELRCRKTRGGVFDKGGVFVPNRTDGDFCAEGAENQTKLTIVWGSGDDISVQKLRPECELRPVWECGVELTEAGKVIKQNYDFRSP